MQSFLQYRRLRKQVEEQYSRHTQHDEKPVALGRARQALRTPSSSTLSSSSSASRSEQSLNLGPVNREKDAEAAIPHAGAPQHTRGGLEGRDAELAQEEAEVGHEIHLTQPQQEDFHALGRVATARSIGTRLGVALTGIAVRDRRTNEGGADAGKVFVVAFEGDNDPSKPQNWSHTSRICATAMIALIGFVVGVASSIDSPATSRAAQEFGVSEVVEILATGLYLIGFGVGALFAGPFSETLGRNPVYIITLTTYMIFIMAAGLAKNIQQQLVFRFLAGFFGSTPLTCAGGSISDLWTPMERVFAFPMFANAAFLGPIMGPVLGGFIAQSTSVTWRWVEWTTLIMSGLVLGLVVIFQPETYAPVLLTWKAQHLRKVTGDQRFVAEMEIRGEPFLRRLGTALYRPFLLTLEPIVLLVTLYLTVIYIVLFTFLDGYDYIFGEIHGTSPGITGLCFLNIAIGLFGASLWVPMIYKWAKRDMAAIQEQGGSRLPPEFRLWYAMFGAPAIPISLLWMGWTSYSHISIWSPIIAGVLFGYGVLCVFISSYQYIIDSYEMYAASALTSVTLVRYVTAGGMTVVGIPFYKNMGVHWTLTILGGISALLVPVPYLFYIYGTKIRGMSKYAVVHE
ncbi:major facilitator superfamily transporter [Stagonosporopsis vannaccii]|nr:major facilitator superfamily transporter [Stagonosporopsis vannaccii]